MSVWKGGVWGSQKFPGGSGVWKGGAWLSQRSATATQVLRDLLFGSGQQGAFYVPKPTVDGQQVLYQDSAGTTPVTADGQPIGSAIEQSGNANTFIQATAAKKPLSKTDGTLHWSQGDGVDDLVNTQIPQMDAAVDTVMAVSFRSLAPTRTNDYICGAGASDGKVVAVRTEFGNFVLVWTASGTRTFTIAPADSADHVLVVESDGTNFNIFFDGASVGSTSIIGASLNINEFTIHALSISDGATVTGESAARVYGVILADGYSAENRDNIENYLADLSGVTLP